MNYYPFHIGDFRSGCIHMSQLERWVYRDLLDVYYDTERTLPLDLDAVCRMVGARTDEHKQAVLAVLQDKFQRTEDGYHNERVESEIAKYRKKADSARSANQRRWASGADLKSEAPQKRPRSEADLKSDADQILTNNQEPITNKPPISPKGVEARFERFWTAYPKKVGKDAARKAFERRKPDESLVESMLQAIAQQARSEQWVRDGGQYIPNPATWINQGRWQDGMEAAPVNSIGVTYV